MIIDEAPGIVASPERIDAWMEVAKPGDRFVYASRLSLPAASKGAAHMRALAKRGLVALTQARSKVDPAIFHYCAQRTPAATALTRPTRPKLAVTPAVLADGEAAVVDALLPVLERFARHGRPCPTDKQLAARAKLTEDGVKAGLAALAASHLIRVQKVSAPTLRRIIIVATGQITGLAA
ncbi:hypothetical protein [Sphingomonas sp. CFBP 13720]|uniref:hypothetical protein n=1 Tax=Sphingomonas sp. CFBP 13720 TaxID=2775302 RepID=UPI00177C0F7B|nr:hypothetical protein [Sphingomonas sp. CFBP 13720]MBD8677945.1 hypothetical protein [Sphingomonas sp. CFBP 13720]